MSSASRSRVESPTLGVVVCALNEERALPALLARLCGESGSPRSDRLDRADRVVVADGGSADRTCEIARSFGAEVAHGERGRGAQLRAGAERIDADVLVFLHADCEPAPGSLAAIRRAFADPRVRAGAFHQRVERAGVFYRWIGRAADLRVDVLGIVYGDCGLCVRSDVYRRVGGFRPIPLFEDVDLSRRLRGPDRARTIDGAILRVSARRWEREGALRTTLRNWMLALAYSVGVAPERLARHYPPHSETS